MLQFIVTIIFVLSLGTVLYLIIRSLPRIEDETSPQGKGKFMDRWAASEIPERIDAAFNLFLGKFLRKLKVFLLKVDYALTQRLNKIKNGNGKPQLGFEEITLEKDNVAIDKIVVEVEEKGNN